MKKTEQTVLKTNSCFYEHFNEQQFYKRSIEKTLDNLTNSFLMSHVLSVCLYNLLYA